MASLKQDMQHSGSGSPAIAWGNIITFVLHGRHADAQATLPGPPARIARDWEMASGIFLLWVCRISIQRSKPPR